MNKSSRHKIYEFEGFRLDAVHLMLYRDGEEIPLPPKAVETLLALIEKRGEILSTDALMETIWTDTAVEESNLSKYLHVLRKTLGNRRNGKPFIETLRRRGYRFNGEVADRDALPEAEPENADPKPENANHDPAPLRPNPDGGTIREAAAGKVVALSAWRRGAETEEENSRPETRPAARAAASPATGRKRIVSVAAVGLFVLTLAFFAFNRFRTENLAKNAPIRTIAILPFKPLAAENRDEVLEIGMADTLIAKLGNNREIVVSPLSSVRKYSNLEQDAAEAGRELGVDSVLDGSIQHRFGKIRVNVRLIKVADGGLLWTGTFDEKFNDIFVVQDAISRRVASELALQLSGEERARLEKRHTNNAEAYELYLRGRFHYFKIIQPEVRRSIEFYQRAIDVDPNYALAFAGMADSYRAMAITGLAPPKDICPTAKALATRALEIDESLAEAYLVLGWIGFLYEWDWERAESHFKTAIELAPNNSEAHRGYAHLLSNAGRHDEAIVEGRRARELAPLTLITAALEAQFLYYAARHDEALERLDKTLELDSNFYVAHTMLGRIYIARERYGEAIAALARAKELAGGSSEPTANLGYALAKSGRREEARAELEELKIAAAKGYVPMYSFAMIYNGLGEKEEALNHLEKSLEEREPPMTFIKIDTRWDWLRSEPRFIELMRRVNFV